MNLSVEDAISKLRRGVLTLEEADAIEALLLSKIEKRSEPTELTARQQVLIDTMHSFFCQNPECGYMKEGTMDLTWDLPDHQAWELAVTRYSEALDVSLDELADILALARSVVNYSSIAASKWKNEVRSLISEIFRVEVGGLVPTFPEVR